MLLQIKSTSNERAFHPLLSSSLGSPEPESTTNEATCQQTNEPTNGQINEGEEEE
jgi:hypothetical protein